MQLSAEEIRRLAASIEQIRASLDSIGVTLALCSEEELAGVDPTGAGIIRAIASAGDLDELLEHIRAAEVHLSSLDLGGRQDDADAFRHQLELLWCDLPTFGGPEPADTLGVASWDEDRLLLIEDRWHITDRQDVN